jgi:hypothetical protein
MAATRIRFTVLLPLASLVAAVFLVAVPVTLVYLNLESFSQGSDTAKFSSGHFSAAIPRNQFLANSLMWGTVRTAPFVGAIDIPGSVAMTLGRPDSLTLDAWRSIILPLSSLPFWWFAGLGLDALRKSVALNWSVKLLGTVMMFGFLTLLIALQYGMSEAERAESPMGWVFCGIALWALLMLPFPLAWLRSRRKPVEVL